MKYILVLSILFSSLGLYSQKYFSKTGEISFVSEAPVEIIEAVNHKATTVIDLESGAIQWSVLIKAFHFEKALMEEHFNENYMESSKFPKATFKGKMLNYSELDFTKAGTIEATIEGKLEIHGVTKDIQTTAIFEVIDSKIIARSDFNILLSDYNIEIPAVVSDNISKSVKVNIIAEYQLLNK